MSRCKWVRVEGRGMVRVREGEAIFFFNKQLGGIMRINGEGLTARIDAFITADYRRSLLSPEWEVFS